jgi:regulator of sigma E protease
MDIKEVPVITKGVPSIISASTKYLWNQTKLFGYSWYQLFTGKLPMSSLHGIIAVAKVGGDIIHSSGLFSGLLLTAVISLYLAIFNFLPIPALDGGHVLFLIIEKIRGKKVDEETADKIMTVFFIFLILLIIVVCANDIYALVMNKI